MSITLPFREGSTVAELGGGERPILKGISNLKSVNVDIRQLANVDIVRNLEEDFTDIGPFDGLFANYLLEHISWRRVPRFVEQCYQILKPESYAVFVAPDTYAQLQKVTQKSAEEITLEDSCFIFGGQNFDDNTHKVLLSRPLVERLFLEAGFESVKITSHPNPEARDVFIEVYKGKEKSIVEKEDAPDRFGVIDVNFSYALPFKEGDGILEVGCGETPLKVEGLNVTHMDVRPLPDVEIIRNIEDGFGDVGSFDGLFCSYTLEHLSWRKVEPFFKECYRVLKPRTHAVFVVPDTYEQAKMLLQNKPEEIRLEDSNVLFGMQEHEHDYHKWFTSQPLLEKMLLSAGFKIVRFTRSPDPKARDIYVDAYKSTEQPESEAVKINLGSFTVTFGHGWINADIRGDIKQAVEAKGHIFEYCDVTKPLRWGDNTVDVITAHHLVEHLDRAEGAYTLRECLRVLKPGGVIRLGTPDLHKFVEMLPRFKVIYANEFEVKNAEDDADAFFRLAFMGHKTIYTYEALRRKAEAAGFTDIKKVAAGESRSNAILTETVDSFPDHSFYLEASKPTQPAVAHQPIITTGKERQQYQRYLDGEVEEGSQNAG